MSTLKVNNLQVGQDGTAANNYTLYQPASPDGTVRLGYGVAGSVTDILTLKNSRLGIGTNDPQASLHAHNASGTTLLRTSVNANSTVGFEIVKTGSTTQSWRIADGQTINGALEFYDVTDSTTRMIIRDGKVGINTISPSYKLHIKETTTASNYAFLENTTAGNAGVRLKNSQGDFAIFVSPDLRFYDLANSIDRLRITNTGKVGIGVNPAANWHSAASSKVIQVGSSVLFDYSAAQFDVGHNYYYDGSNYRFISTGYAERITFSKSNGSIRFWSLGTGSADAVATVSEKLRITSDGKIGIGGLTNPGALLSIPAGESNTPRLAIESAVDDNDFTITQYEDGNGTYTMLGQNVKLNSGGNNTILDSGHKTAGILLDARNHGAITFLTGGTNAVEEPVKITADGYMGIGTTGPGAPLHILSTAYPTALIQRDHSVNYARLRLSNTANHGADLDGIGDGSPAGGFRISTVNAATSTERFRINGDGSIKITGINRNSPFSVSNVSGTVFILDDTQPSAVGTGGKIVFGSKYYNAANTMGTAFIGSYKDNAPSNGANEYEHSLIFGANSSSAGFTQKMRLTHRGCLFLHDGIPSQSLNSKTRLEIRGSAISTAGVDVDYFKGFKLALDDATEWGGQVQHAVGRYEESGSSARTSYMISLGHGALNSSSDADVNVMEMRSNGCVMTPGQPSFQATGQPSYRYMNVWQNTPLISWNFVDVNTGSHFSNSTGKFTAPVSGKYFFIYTTMFQNPSTNDFAIKLHKNGTMMVISNNHSGGGSTNGHTWNDATVQAIIHLDPGDWVTAEASASNSSTCFIYGSGNSRYGSFSGFLIG